MPLRIAAVSFLNTWPLIEGLGDEPDVDLTTALPSALPPLLADDAADLALMPVFAYLTGTGAALVPGVAIAGRGAVDSVKLFARRPPAELDTVLVDRGSRTSVALLQVLLAERWGVQPRFVSGRPDPANLDDHDAVMAIGDLCFAVERAVASRPDWRAHDLGDLWHALTGLPFVFAAWTCGTAFLERADAATLARAVDLLTRAKARGLARLDALADRAVAAGQAGVGGAATRDAILAYWRESLVYDLGAEELTGLARFGDLCAAHDLVPAARPLRLVGPDGVVVTRR